MNTNLGKSLPKLNGLGKAALVLGVILSLALSQLVPASGQTARTSASRPSGVLTFTGANAGSGYAESLFDYNLTTRELTDYGEGKDGYRGKDGTALIAFHHSREDTDDLVLVSADGKTRTTLVKDFKDYSGNFILSLDGTTAIYCTSSIVHTDDGARNVDILTTHIVQTGEEKTPFGSSIGMLVPQDWMPDGRLLVTPFEEQEPVVSNGKPFILNFAIMSKDLSSTMSTCDVDQPGTKPVKQIFDPRLDRSGKRLVFAWDHHIWVSNADGSGAKQVTESDSYENWPAWSPDGKWLAFTHKESGAAVGSGATWDSMYLMPADGRKHTMSDPAVKELKDKAGKGMICYGRITWR